MKNWFAIQNSATALAADISIFDEIGRGVTAKDFITATRAVTRAETFNLSINSPGGDAFEGFAIYNFLQDLKDQGKTINVKIMGIAASIASVVAMAASPGKLAMPKNAMMMVHNPWTVAAGNADELRDTAKVLDMIGKSIRGIYAARTGKSDADLQAILDADTFMSADEAKTAGFADSVVAEVKVSASFDVGPLPANARAVFAPKLTDRTAIAVVSVADIYAKRLSI